MKSSNGAQNMKNEAYEILFIMDPSVLRMSHFSMRNNGSKIVEGNAGRVAR
jgi:hypothetical protein